MESFFPLCEEISSLKALKFDWLPSAAVLCIDFHTSISSWLDSLTRSFSLNEYLCFLFTALYSIECFLPYILTKTVSSVLKMITSIVEKKALSKQFFCVDSLDEQEKKVKIIQHIWSAHLGAKHFVHTDYTVYLPKPFCMARHLVVKKNPNHLMPKCSVMHVRLAIEIVWDVILFVGPVVLI